MIHILIKNLPTGDKLTSSIIEYLSRCGVEFSVQPILEQADVSGSCNHSFVWLDPENDENLDRRCEICGFVELHDR